MARALLNAADIFIPEMLHTCYASFDSGAGKEFEEGKLNLERPRPSFPLFLSSSSVLHGKIDADAFLEDKLHALLSDTVTEMYKLG